MYDKVIVTNLSALKKKYGKRLPEVKAAIKRLIDADKKRGIKTTLVALDSEAAMKKLKGRKVSDPADQKQNKAAIDAVFKSLLPDYLLILGAVDIVPHQELNNPLYDVDGDLDRSIPGDVAYACEAPFSKKPQDFIGPTRAVGRLPDITGGGDAGYIMGLLETAANWKALPAKDYSSYLGISADEWKESTGLSLKKLFGSGDDLKLSPEEGPKWKKVLISRRVHFINCHGGDTDWRFLGQRGDEYPISHDASYLNKRISEGTVAAMECCYGAQLYDPAKLQNKQPGICNIYLEQKAYGYLGSTTIAYGPESGNGAADLICQYFLKNVLKGETLGAAALNARQEFAQSSPELDPYDLKTLAQFNLLGDPSIRPVATPTPHTTATLAKALGARSGPNVAAARSDRRQQTMTNGLLIAEYKPVAQSPASVALSSSVEAKLKKLAQESDIGETKILSFGIQPKSKQATPLARSMMSKMAKKPSASAFHVIVSRKPLDKAPIPRIVALVAKEVDGEIVSYRELHSK